VTAAVRLDEVEQDQRVVLTGMSWQDFEAFLALRGDRAGARMYYLEGEIEIVTPTKIHEGRKTTLARLLEVWALESGVALNGFGAWTLKNEMRQAGAEPDECYILGEADEQTPHLVIEVEWSRQLGLPKREIYRRLGVRELWTLKANGALLIHVASDKEWLESSRSQLLPALNPVWLSSFLSIESQSKAVAALRDALLAERSPK
jgi:Uma2 family endonuclease